MRSLVILTAVLAFSLTACGDGEPGDTASPNPAGPAPAEDALITDVSSVAPALESYYRGGPYPQTLDEAVASLVPAGVTLAPGHTVGGYTYDADATEFVLCLQDADGAWASYDTAPMGVKDSGTEGGCPAE